MLNRKNLKESIYNNLPGILLAAGIIVRLRQFFFNRSLWTDEAALAINFVNRSYAGLLKPLENNQAAPPGFLFVVKWVTNAFGCSEWALRLFPLFCGVVGIFLFYKLARKVLNDVSAKIALAFFCLAYPLVYYSAEVKQYSCDVLVSVCLLLLALDFIWKKPNLKKSVFWAIAGALSIWFSFSAVFILAAITGVGLYKRVKARSKKEILAHLAVSLFWILNFVALYILTTKNLVISDRLLNFWGDGFMPAGILPKIKWMQQNMFLVFADFVNWESQGLAAVALVTGCVFLYKHSRECFYLFVLPILFTLIAACLRLYPFKARMILFLLPIFIVLMSEGLRRIFIRLWTERLRVGAVLFVGFVFLKPVVRTAEIFVKPIQVEELRPVLGHLASRRQSGDSIYVYYASKMKAPAFRYYASRYGLRLDECRIGPVARRNISEYILDLQQYRGKKRVWFVFSHVYKLKGVDEEKFILGYLNTVGKQLDSFRAKDASVYLYDLRHGGNTLSGEITKL